MVVRTVGQTLKSDGRTYISTRRTTDRKISLLFSSWLTQSLARGKDRNNNDEKLTSAACLILHGCRMVCTCTVKQNEKEGLQVCPSNRNLFLSLTLSAFLSLVQYTLHKDLYRYNTKYCTSRMSSKQRNIPNTKNNNNNNVILPPPSSQQRRLLSNSMIRHKTRLPITIRLSLIGGCLGFLFQDMFRSILLPFGPPNYNWGTRPTYSNLDTSNDSLMLKRKIKISKFVFVFLYIVQ